MAHKGILAFITAKYMNIIAFKWLFTPKSVVYLRFRPTECTVGYFVLQ